MEPKSIFLKRPEVTKVVTSLREAEMPLSYDFEKHKYTWEEQGMEFSLRLPITIFSNEEGLVDLEKEVTYHAFGSERKRFGGSLSA